MLHLFYGGSDDFMQPLLWTLALCMLPSLLGQLWDAIRLRCMIHVRGRSLTSAVGKTSQDQEFPEGGAARYSSNPRPRLARALVRGCRDQSGTEDEMVYSGGLAGL